MLHEARIDFRRRIVNQTRRSSCRAAAQFNPGLEVLRRGSGECPAKPARGWGGLGEGRVDGLQWVTG